ncbi:MAG TPA: ATP-binding protein [Anaerolineaceae bacterium]|nr:ATP-binding protein [Anaerolineaceae bacterium]HPN52959.1 ATP-binding protein [Anaerolineaceae bacterium]
MNQPAPPLRTSPFLLRTINPLGLLEFNELMALTHEPLILVDAGLRLIAGANPDFYRLTSFTQREIQGANLDDLLPGFPAFTPNGIEQSQGDITLLTRKGSAIPGSFRVQPLNAGWKSVVIFFTPFAVQQQQLAQKQGRTNFYKSMAELSKICASSSLEEALLKAAAISQNLLNAGRVNIYHASGQKPRLDLVTSSAGEDIPELPDHLTSTDLVRLNEPAIWFSGRRVSSELHRAARVAGYHYLASIPLGTPNAWSGLLVAAEMEKAPIDDILEILEILASHITQAIEHFLSIHGMQQRIEALEQELILSQAFSNYTEEGIIVLDADFNIKNINPAAEMILGYAKNEVINHPVESVLIGAEPISYFLKSVLDEPTSPSIRVLKFHQRNGSTFPARFQAIPIQHQPGFTSPTLVLIFSDISENEQIKLQTQQLEQRALLGEVTAIFAHEVRNPINNISLNVQSMMMMLPEEDPNHETCERMLNDCGRLSHLMDSILFFSKNKEYRMEAVDIHALLKRILDRWRPKFTGANIKHELVNKSDNTRISGDMRALEQVFTNLISNAVEAMSAVGNGGSIRVRIAPAANKSDSTPQLEISLTDDGPGVPEEIRPHLFEPFMTTKDHGTGLGLAITKRIITTHRGTINLKSVPGGTSFIITLPVYIDSQPQPVPDGESS